LAPALELPTWQIADAPEYDEEKVKGRWVSAATGWWKLPAVERIHQEGRRLIWTDDDLDAAQKIWPRSSLTDLLASERVLGVCPVSAEGLSREHLVTIANFLDLEYDTKLLPGEQQSPWTYRAGSNDSSSHSRCE
jgi:hypothetical protein